MSEPNWTERQDALGAFLASHRAEQAPYRLDLRACRLYWVDQDGDTLAIADCRVLCNYALSNRSVLMSWCNASLPEDCKLEAVRGFSEVYQDLSPVEVWSLACDLATAVKAEAIYRAVTPQSWVLLGLWRLRRGEDERFEAGAPCPFVLRVLTLLAEHQDQSELKVLLDNYAETFLQMACFSHSGGPFEEPLRTTAREMRNLLPLLEGDPAEGFGTQILKLHQAWQKLDQQG